MDNRPLHRWLCGIFSFNLSLHGVCHNKKPSWRLFTPSNKSLTPCSSHSVVIFFEVAEILPFTEKNCRCVARAQTKLVVAEQGAVQRGHPLSRDHAAQAKVQEAAEEGGRHVRSRDIAGLGTSFLRTWSKIQTERTSSRRRVLRRSGSSLKESQFPQTERKQTTGARLRSRPQGTRCVPGDLTARRGPAHLIEKRLLQRPRRGRQRNGRPPDAHVGVLRALNACW